MKTHNLIAPKNLKSITLIALSTLLFSACATQDISDESNKNVAKIERECRPQEQLGTRVKRSVCHTSTIWAKIDEINAKDEAAMQADKDAFFRKVRDLTTSGGGRTFGGDSSAPTGP